MKKSLTGLRTNDKRVLEAWMNRNVDTISTAKSMLSKLPDKPNVLEDSWRAVFSEHHKNLIRHQ